MADALDLGCFSMSLTVADIETSVEFYAALGFRVIGGEDNYRILSNGLAKLGLFQGVIDANILTFNPGIGQDWNPEEGEGMPSPQPGFTDVREIERRLGEAGITLTHATESDAGPDHITLVDPDGNQILIDQFF